jgi:hypothetical protein
MMHRLIVIILAILLAASSVHAAITYDTASSTSANATSTTQNHTFAADANFGTICVMQRDTGGAVGAASGVTVNGDPATPVTSGGLTHSGSVLRIDMFYYPSPPSGVQEIIATGHANTDAIVTIVKSFKGVNLSDPLNTAKTAQGTSTNADIDTIASAVGELVDGCFNVRTFGTTIGPDATAPVSTERIEDPQDEAGTNGINTAGYTEDGAATSINMRVDLGASVQWEGVAVSIRAAAEATRRPIAPMVFQ